MYGYASDETLSMATRLKVNWLMYARTVIFGGCVQTGKDAGDYEYVPQDMARIVEVVRLIPQDRVQQHTVEQVVDVPVPQVVALLFKSPEAHDKCAWSRRVFGE